MQTQTLVLSGADIASLVQREGADAVMDTLIERLGVAFCDLDHAEFSIPARDGFRYSEPFSGLVEWMPILRRGERVMMKLVGYHPDNPALHGLPTILSTLAMFDQRTGHLEAVADGALLTAMRTGAASAVASRHLAEPSSSSLGLIGAGAQAVTQLHALSRVFPLREVRLHDAEASAVESFRERVAALDLTGVEIIAASLGEVIDSSDIVCTATSVDVDSGPVFDPVFERRDHLHINAVGSDLPGKTEVPLAWLRDALVVPDFLGQALVEGECQQLEGEEIGPELRVIIAESGKFDAACSGLTVFDSTGFALEDYVALEMALAMARESGVGAVMDFAEMPTDPRSPYECLAGAKIEARVR